MSLQTARENLLANMAKAKKDQEAKQLEYLAKEQERIKIHLEEKAKREEDAKKKAVEKAEAKAEAELEKKTQAEKQQQAPVPEPNKQPFVIDPNEKSKPAFWWENLPKRKQKRKQQEDEYSSRENTPPPKKKKKSATPPPVPPQQVVLQVTQPPVDPNVNSSFFDQAAKMALPLFGLAASFYIKNKYAPKEHGPYVEAAPVAQQEARNPFQTAFKSAYMAT